LQYQNVHQLLLYLALSRSCRVFLSCLPLLTKPPLVCQVTVRVCLFVTSTVAKQVTAHPTVQVTFIQTKCTTVVTVDSFPHSCYLYFAVSDFIECNIKFILALISPTDRYLLKYQVYSCSENLGKCLGTKVAPQVDVTSVQVFQYLF